MNRSCFDAQTPGSMLPPGVCVSMGCSVSPVLFPALVLPEGKAAFRFLLAGAAAALAALQLAFLPLGLQRFLRLGTNAMSPGFPAGFPLHPFGIHSAALRHGLGHRLAEGYLIPVRQQEGPHLVILGLRAEGNLPAA